MSSRLSPSFASVVLMEFPLESSQWIVILIEQLDGQLSRCLWGEQNFAPRTRLRAFDIIMPGHCVKYRVSTCVPSFCELVILA